MTSVYFCFIPKGDSTSLDRILFEGEERSDGSIFILQPLEYRTKKIQASDAFVFRDLTDQKTGPMNDITYEFFLAHMNPSFPKSREITSIDTFKQFQEKMNKSIRYIFKTPPNFTEEDLEAWRTSLYQTAIWLKEQKDFNDIPLQKFIHLKKLFKKVFKMMPSSIEEMRSKESRIAKFRNELQNPV